MAKGYKQTKKDKKFQKDRYELAMRYAKSTFIRYFTAGLAVLTIYWIFLAYLSDKRLVIQPLAYFILYAIAMADQYLTLHSKPEREFKLTDIIMKISIVGDIAAIALAYFKMDIIFPYMASFMVVAVIFIIVIFIKLIIINKIKKIKS